MTKVNTPKGSTRTKMTKEETEWLRNFNNALNHDDEKSLKEICSDGGLATDIRRRITDGHNARRRDIYSNMGAANLGEHEAIEPDETLDFIADDSANPKQSKTKYGERYTPEDYNKPGVPDEDGLIGLLDANRSNNKGK